MVNHRELKFPGTLRNHKEDKETVQEAFRELIADGVYAEALWE